MAAGSISRYTPSPRTRFRGGLAALGVIAGIAALTSFAPGQPTKPRSEQAKLALFDLPPEKAEEPPKRLPEKPPLVEKAAPKAAQPRVTARPLERAYSAPIASPVQSPAPLVRLPAASASLPTREPAPPPAAAPRSAQPDNASVKADYARKLWAHISAYRPGGAHIPGTARIRFVVHSDGTLDQITLAGPSGSRMLDRLALRTVRRASPGPGLPAQLGEETAFTLDFNFD